MVDESLVEYLKIAGSVLGVFAVVGLIHGVYRTLYGVRQDLALLHAGFESPFQVSVQRYPDQNTAGKFLVLDTESFATLFALEAGLVIEVPILGKESNSLFFAWDQIERFRADEAQRRATFQK